MESSVAMEMKVSYYYSRKEPFFVSIFAEAKAANAALSLMFPI